MDRIAAAVANPDEWKPSESALDFALRDFSEPLFIQRWRAVLTELDSLMPILINNPHLLLKPSYGLALLLKYFKQALRKILDFFGFLV